MGVGGYGVGIGGRWACLPIAIGIDEDAWDRRVRYPIGGGVENEGVSMAVAIAVGDKRIGLAIARRVDRDEWNVQRRPARLGWVEQQRGLRPVGQDGHTPARHARDRGWSRRGREHGSGED